MLVFTGIVTEGRKRGATLGFPTANIVLQGRVEDATLSGIYAGRVRIGDDSYGAALYVEPSSGLLEAHLLDFSGDLYGKEITVEVGGKIRENKEFKNDAEARATIADDIGRIREYLKVQE